MGVSLVALIEAGQVGANDNTLAIIQNIEYSTACSIAEWLVLATGKPAKLQWMTMGEACMIERTPEQVAQKARTVG